MFLHFLLKYYYLHSILIHINTKDILMTASYVINQYISMHTCIGSSFLAIIDPEPLRDRTHLEVGQLAKDLAAHVALVADLPVLPGERVGQGLVADGPSFLALPQVHGVLGLPLWADPPRPHGGAGRGGEAVHGGPHALGRGRAPG